MRHEGRRLGTGTSPEGSSLLLFIVGVILAIFMYLPSLRMSVVGEFILSVTKGLFGTLAFLLPLYFFSLALAYFVQEDEHKRRQRAVHFLLAFIFLAALLQTLTIDNVSLSQTVSALDHVSVDHAKATSFLKLLWSASYDSSLYPSLSKAWLGGLLGGLWSTAMNSILGRVGSALFFLFLLGMQALFLFNFSVLRFLFSAHQFFKQSRAQVWSGERGYLENEEAATSSTIGSQASLQDEILERQLHTSRPSKFTSSWWNKFRSIFYTEYAEAEGQTDIPVIDEEEDEAYMAYLRDKEYKEQTRTQAYQHRQASYSNAGLSDDENTSPLAVYPQEKNLSSPEHTIHTGFASQDFASTVTKTSSYRTNLQEKSRETKAVSPVLSNERQRAQTKVSTAVGQEDFTASPLSSNREHLDLKPSRLVNPVPIGKILSTDPQWEIPDPILEDLEVKRIYAPGYAVGSTLQGHSNLEALAKVEPSIDEPYVESENRSYGVSKGEHSNLFAASQASYPSENPRSCMTSRSGASLEDQESKAVLKSTSDEEFGFASSKALNPSTSTAPLAFASSSVPRNVQTSLAMHGEQEESKPVSPIGNASYTQSRYAHPVEQDLSQSNSTSNAQTKSQEIDEVIPQFANLEEAENYYEKLFQGSHFLEEESRARAKKIFEEQQLERRQSENTLQMNHKMQGEEASASRFASSPAHVVTQEHTVPQDLAPTDPQHLSSQVKQTTHEYTAASTHGGVSKQEEVAESFSSHVPAQPMSSLYETNKSEKVEQASGIGVQVEKNAYGSQLHLRSYEQAQAVHEKVQKQDAGGFASFKDRAHATLHSVQATMREKGLLVHKPYQFPSLSMLQPEKTNLKVNTEALKEQAEHLEATMKSFGVEAKVVNVTTGPSITRFEVAPGVGVKVNKISNLIDDIALALAAETVRIEAPIPGKPAVGIEIPNKETTPVFLRGLLEDESFQKAESVLTVALGRDISGAPLLCDLSKMPHLLIAGATGSGKSVCINSILISLLYKARPEEVKLLLIDPKVVELKMYNDIPHLIAPVVTDPKKAANTLRWAVNEMTKRYSLFAEKAARDLKSYNEQARQSGEDPLPLILIVIDELADLMVTVANEVEDSIARLTAMARAAGIHLIIATQRPSVDVLTGVIKANIPSRIAFAVSSHIDSRTIIDGIGAEKLLGKGDMLYAPQTSSKSVRAQGAYVSDAEVEIVTSFAKAQNYTGYDTQIVEEMTSSSLAKNTKENADTEEAADMAYIPQAMEIFLETGQASTSILQRRLKLGYPRATRIVEILEKLGYIGPHLGSRPRKLLLSRERWEAILEEKAKEW